ncbi:hypothetical protein [Methylomonas sp. HYX-M1]|uniref:hypothetical protein n=1 Tax=Methylomonas sp. HYX-M1 TaxID=3139307 RepID=UPI00345BC8C3
MKVSINFDFDTEVINDVESLHHILNTMHSLLESNAGVSIENAIEIAWRKCSWELIALAVTVLTIREGETDKGVYATFKNLRNPHLQLTCGLLTERAISSMVGRTAVVCKPLGEFRLMLIATRRKDNEKRVYVASGARETLLRMLQTSWGEEFRQYIEDKGLDMPDFSRL